MAQQYSRSPLRIPLTDTNRIKSGLDRAEKILQKDIATSSRHVPPITDISVHGLWDGIVGHPVDVKISLTIAAQPNIRHAVIAISHPVIEAAQIHSITNSSSNVPTDEDPSPSAIRSFENGPVVDEHGAKLENGVKAEPWTDSCDSKGIRPPCKRRSILVGQRSVYGTEDYGWPLLPNGQNGSIDGMNTQSPSSRDKQAIRVGKRSVYGTDPFQEPFFIAPTAQNPSGHAPYESPQTYDWSGDTLVASQADHFVKTGHPSTHPIAETTLLVPRKRTSPGKKPWGSQDLTEAFIEHDKWLHEGLLGEKAQPNTDLVLTRQDQQLADSTSSEQESCLSTGTVLFNYQTDITSTDESPQKNAPILLGAPTPTPAQSSQFSPPKHVHSISPMKGTRRKKAWESSSPRDVSPRLGANKDGEKPPDASLNGNLVSRSRPRRPEGTERRIRSRSLSQLDHDQTPRTKPQALLEPEMSEVSPRRPEGKDMRKRSRSLSHLRHDQTLRTKPDKYRNSLKSEFKAVTLGRARGRQTKSNTNNIRTPTRSRTQTFEFNEPSASYSSNHSGSGAQDAQSSITANSPNNTLGCTDQYPGNDDPGYSASLDSDHSNTPIQPSPRKTRDAKSPDITNPPWLRRDISSSKYFPEEKDTPVPARQPTRAPFWINYEGNLVVCFPNNVAPKLYEVDIHAKIHLSDTDEDGWRTFSVPGLPSLDGSQEPGRTSLSLTSPLQYQFDQSFLQGAFTCGPNLVVGASRFGSLPILRVRNEAFDLDDCHALRSFRDEKQSYLRYHHILETMSLPNGMPDNDLLVWLLERMGKAVSVGPLEEPFNSWFSHLDFPRLKAKMEMFSHKNKEQDPSSLEYTPLHPTPKQAEKSIGEDEKSLLGHRTESLNLRQDVEQSPGPFKYTLLHPIFEQAKKARTEKEGSSLDSRTVQGKKVAHVSSGIDEKLFPAYFGGLACANNPMDNEDLSGLAWSFKLSVSRAMNGKLQCRLKMDLPPGAKPYLRIDARDWTPNFALVNRRLAADTDWHETEVGDIVLQRVTPRDAGETTKVEIHFEERTIDQQIRLQHEQHRLEKRLPNVVDKVILGGLLSCYLAKALITLTDASGEEVSWRTDSSNVRDDIALPKLGIGYLMHLSLTVPESEEERDTEDDLETISDIEASLDKAVATPRLKKGRPNDLGVVDADDPQDVQPSANPPTDPQPNPFADPPDNPFADPSPNSQADPEVGSPDQPPEDQRPAGHGNLRPNPRPSNRRFWVCFPFLYEKNPYCFSFWLVAVLVLFAACMWAIGAGIKSGLSSSPDVSTRVSEGVTTTTVFQIGGIPSSTSGNGEEEMPKIMAWGLLWRGVAQPSIQASANEQVTTTRGVTPGHGPRPIDTDIPTVLQEEYGIVDRGVEGGGGAMETRRDVGGVEERGDGGRVDERGDAAELDWFPRAWRDRADRALGWWEVAG